MQRKLAAILAADVVGYSRRMRADETGTLAAMKALWSEVVKPSVRTHRGRVFKLMGDGMLAEFASVVDAANAAEAIQTSANGRASDQPEDRRIQLRIGINLGDVVVDGTDLYGDGVNIAARLQEVAPVGGIALSATTHENLAGKSSLTFVDAGERSLKNIDQPVHVWLWLSSASEPSAPALASHTDRRSSQPSIAVLPFQNLSSAEDAEFFADGMTEDVINALSKFRWLFVIARGTMFTYKGRMASTAEVARGLNVRYVLEGSVRLAGDRIRLTAELVDSKGEYHLWAERFDRELNDIFTIQDEITGAIAAKIAPEIERAERQRVDDTARTDVDAWVIYQRGLASYYEASDDGLSRAVLFFDQAFSLDRKFTPAIAMSAAANAWLAATFRPSQSESLMAIARKKAAQAIALDARDPLSLWASGRVHTFSGNFDAAIAQSQEAITYNPNAAMAYFGVGNAMTRKGQSEEALNYIARAIELSPSDPFLSSFLVNQAVALFCLQRFNESAETARRCVLTGRATVWAYATLAVALLRSGDIGDAKAATSVLMDQFPNTTLNYIEAAQSYTTRTFVDPLVTGLRELGVPEE